MFGGRATGNCPRQTETRQGEHGRGDSPEKHASVAIQVGHSSVFVPPETVGAMLTVELSSHLHTSTPAGAQGYQRTASASC